MRVRLSIIAAKFVCIIRELFDVDHTRAIAVLVDKLSNIARVAGQVLGLELVINFFLEVSDWHLALGITFLVKFARKFFWVTIETLKHVF